MAKLGFIKFILPIMFYFPIIVFGQKKAGDHNNGSEIGKNDLQLIEELVIEIANINSGFLLNINQALSSVSTTLNSNKEPSISINAFEKSIDYSNLAFGVFQNLGKIGEKSIPALGVALNIIKEVNISIAKSKEDEKIISDYKKEILVMDIITDMMEKTPKYYPTNHEKIRNNLKLHFAKLGPFKGRKHLMEIKEKLKPLNKLQAIEIGDKNYLTILFKFKIIEEIIKKVNLKDFVICDVLLDKCTKLDDWQASLKNKVDSCPRLVNFTYAFTGPLRSQMTRCINNLFVDLRSSANLKLTIKDLYIPIQFRITTPSPTNGTCKILVNTVRNETGVKISGNINWANCGTKEDIYLFLIDKSLPGLVNPIIKQISNYTVAGEKFDQAFFRDQYGPNNVSSVIIKY